jgi:4'-phosphopantetheinyl transferase
VSLWWVALDGPRSAERELEAQLAPGERRRADRFLRPLDRRRFVVARGSLRRLLASQLGCAPREVPIVTDGRGKPGLAGSELRFSISRSAGVALYALSWTMEVGVDVEAIQESADLDRIAARFFSAAERRALASLPAGRRRLAGFQCWTRKEAYAKGTGDGITLPLADTHVGIDGCCTVGTDWSVHQIDVAPGFVAAVAGSEVGAWVPRAPRAFGAVGPDRVPGTESDARVRSVTTGQGRQSG